MKLRLPTTRRVTGPLMRAWRWTVGLVPEMPDAPDGILPQAKHKVGFFRTLTAPGWRSLVRWAVIITGFGVYIFAQLVLAYLVNSLQWWFIVGAFVIVTCAVFAAWKPGTTFIAWLVLSPFGLIFLRLDFGAGVPAVTFDRVVLLGMMCLLIARMMLDRQRARRLIAGEYMMWGYIVYTALSLYLSRSGSLIGTLRVVAERFDHIVLAVVAYYIARAVLSDRKHVIWCLVALSITGMAVTLSAFYEHFTGSMWFSSFMGADYHLGYTDVGLGRAAGPLLNPGTMGSFLGITAFITLHLIGPVERKSVKLLGVVAVALQLVGCWFSFTRSGYLSAVILLALMPFAAKRYRANYAALVGVMALVALIYAPIALGDARTYRRLTQDKTVLTRLALSATFINIIKHHLVFGCGVGNMSNAMQQYVTNAGTVSGIYAYGRSPSDVRPSQSRSRMISSHNSFLTIGAEEGLLGLGLYVGAILLMLLHIIRVRARLPDEGILGKDLIALILVVVFAHMASIMNYDISMFRYPNYVLWVMFAVALRVGEIAEQEKRAEQSVVPAQANTRPILVHAYGRRD